jgi:hypothetical protein
MESWLGLAEVGHGLGVFRTSSFYRRRRHHWANGTQPSSYQLITPIGIAIGIGLHSVYNPNSSAALLSSGVLDSISAGILVYAGLVEMYVVA